MALLMLMRRMGHTEVPHGLRSSFRNWSADTGKDYHVAEACLAHAVGTKTERAYLRTSMLDRRRALLTEWADHVTGATADKMAP